MYKRAKDTSLPTQGSTSAEAAGVSLRLDANPGGREVGDHGKGQQEGTSRVLTSNSASGVRGCMRIAGLEVPALCIGNALGSCTPGVQSVWVAWFIKRGSLTTSEIGWLGSSEQFLIAISALIVSACWQHANRRFLAVAAASLVAIANAVAMLPAIQTLIIGRLLSGVGTGVLLACMIGTAARRKGAQRVLALMQGTVVLLMSTIYFVSPILVGRYGPAGLFGFIAGIAMAGAAALAVGLPDLAPAATKVTGVTGTPGVSPMLGCLALTSIVIGVNTVSVYMFTIGNRLGFGPRTMGNVLAAVGPLAVLGPVAAHILGERLGLLRPLLFGLVMIASNFFFVVSAASPLLLCIHAAVQSMGLLFCMTYAIALVSRVDASGRFVSAVPAFIMIGSAVGPKLGSELIGFAQFRALAAVAASCVTVGILLFVTLDQATSKAARRNLYGVLP